MTLRRIAGILLLLSSAASAQQAAHKPATGSVTGYVMCADTQRPARFASIMLIPKDAGKSQPQPGASAGVEAHSGLDGTYTVTDVPVGDYYALAQLSGYALPIKMMANAKDAEDAEKALADIPLIHVAADRSVTANLTLIRGAVITGQVLFDDGMPVINAVVRLESIEGVDPEQVVYMGILRFASESAYYSSTDYRGGYSFVGVRPGKYHAFVEITAQGGVSVHGNFYSPDRMQMIRLYAPGKFHQRDAQVIEVKGSEEIPGTDMKLSLDATHTVSGRVLSREDGHAPNHAFVSLQDAVDKTFRLSVTADADGEFHLRYVPEGTYLLSAQAADGGDLKDANNPRSYDVLRRYERQTVSVIVTNQDIKIDDVMMEPSKIRESK